MPRIFIIHNHNLVVWLPHGL
uniref:Uncharacterized protein n=1 Tax=Arundo donax TaxID=35708 RepID=A0A0A9SZ93_ARUDO